MSSRIRLALPVGFLLALLLLALAACGAGPSSRGMPSRAGGTSGAVAQTVTVTLSDFKIEASQTAFKAGVPYHFVVTNAAQSSTHHEFMIVMPMSGAGMNMEDMDQMALHMVDEDQLPPGATQSFDLTFKEPVAAGELEFACHVGSHYQLGMHIPITVE
jgi:uncharacterized cupredoxin-like copper-binding protein